jgi:hypothetical protein
MTIGSPSSPTFAIDISASGLGGEAGEITLESGGALTIDKGINADGPSLEGTGGDITIRGCTVTVLPTATLSAKQMLGTITLGDGDQMNLSGALLSADPSTGAITLNYRNTGQVPITTGTTFDGPVPTIAQDPNLPNCDVDDDGFLNAEDNCPHTSNPVQEDSGGIGLGSPPDDIGDACQCGDLDDDGVVTGTDLRDGREGLTDAGKFIAAPQKWNVVGLVNTALHPLLPVSQDCEINDMAVLKRALENPGLDQTSLQECAPAVP